MKTRSIASGFVMGIASLLGVIAQGCSAETGSPESAVGTTAEALQASPVAHDFGSACLLNGTVTDQNNVDRAGDKLLVIGGYAVTGTTYNRRWDLYDVTADAWIATGSFGAAGDERAFASTIPLSSSSCLLAGGANNTADTPNTFKFSISAKAIAVASAGALNGIHGKAALAPCGSGKAIIAGGTDNAGSPTLDNSIEVWDGSTTWTTQNATLSQARYSLAMAATTNGSNTQFLAAGGIQSGPAFSGVVDVITTTAGCTSATPAAIVTDNRLLENSGLSNHDITARGGLVAFKTSTNDQVQFAGGDEATALSSTAPALVVDFPNHKLTVGGATNTASPPSVAYPTLVDDGSGNMMLVGGIDHTKVAITNLTKYTGSFATPTTTTLSSARVGAPAIYFSSLSRVLTVSGSSKLDGQSGATDVTSMESLQY